MTVTSELNHDKEKYAAGSYLYNASIGAFSWENINVDVNDRVTKLPKSLLSNVSGTVKAGEILALMGSSGCGKTTLLNILARRGKLSSSGEGSVLTDGVRLPLASFQRASCYVEQEDALIGSLTVRETVDFSARLSLPRFMSKTERLERVDTLLSSFGLTGQSNTLIGTPLRKGISGGQKRRVSVVSQIITGPRILFLDEPTSGLDSAASHEVIAFLKTAAQRYNLLVIASIHQPSTSTFELFDKLLLLSQGKICYHGTRSGVKDYFDSIGFRMPTQINPAEYLLDITNVDFVEGGPDSQIALNKIHSSWAMHTNSTSFTTASLSGLSDSLENLPRPSPLFITWVLFNRMFIKSYRDVVAYGIRMAMYIGLAVMMGTVWLRLPTSQESIQPFINAIFFGCAFMSFMAVAYVPAYIEDHATFVKDRANGLYGALPFLIANFLIGLPYLFLIAVIFSSIAYWLSNFQPTASAFFTWIMWLFLDLLAAESLVVLVASLFPIFVLSLAIVAFANGLWMSVGGFLVTPTILNVFWKYVFHYIDYQTYVFQGMMVNEFSQRTYSCGNDCSCMYTTALASECRIAGTGILDGYGYATDQKRQWVGILLGIIVGYRTLGWLALHFRR